MKKFLMEQIPDLFMNLMNLLIYGIYRLTHTMYLSWVLLLIDAVLFKAAFELVREHPGEITYIVSLILSGLALVGAVVLTVMGIGILFGGVR